MQLSVFLVEETQLQRIGWEYNVEVKCSIFCTVNEMVPSVFLKNKTRMGRMWMAVLNCRSTAQCTSDGDY